MHLPQIDKYAHISSFFSSWDPRLKILSLSSLILSIALLPNKLGAVLGLILSIAFVFLSKIPFPFILKQLKGVLFFVLFFLVVMPLSASGGKFYFISLNGLEMATFIAIRTISICLLIFPMIGTMKFHTTLKALSRLKVPNKLIQILMLTYRYIFVFIEDMEKMLISSRARFFRKKTNIHTLKITSNLVGMLFIRGFEQTEKIYNAMVARGYQGSLKIQDEFRFCFKDFFKTVLVMATAFLLHL